MKMEEQNFDENVIFLSIRLIFEWYGFYLISLSFDIFVKFTSAIT